MALVAASVLKKERLEEKGRLRPHSQIRKKLPDGTGLLEELPRRAPGASEGDEAADAAYCAAIEKVSKVFGQRRAQTTADEHKM